MIDFDNLKMPADRTARMLYFLGVPQKDIAEAVQHAPSQITYWKQQQGWDQMIAYDRCEMMTEMRYYQILWKDKKSNNDLKELDALRRILDKTFFPRQENKNKRGTKNLASADFDVEEFKKKVHEKWMDELFPYQRAHVEKVEKIFKDVRSSGESMLLKGRQIGMTKTLGEAALKRLCDTGNDQIFIASSLRQSFQAREYIKDFIQDITGERIQGTETLTFWDGARIDFLATNFRTAQGYSGDVTIDEFLWMQNFYELSKFVSGCATLAQYNVRYSSTASFKGHPGYLKWIGSAWNKKNHDNPIPVDHASLKDGILCEDGIFRQIITTEDAVEQGNHLINLDRLKLRYDADEYGNLFLAWFIDTSESFFNANHIQSCMVDSYFAWDDFFIEERPQKPYADRQVVIGFDPAKEIDISACAVIALPTPDYPKKRVLETFNWHGTDYVEQVENIKRLTERYNVAHIGIDRTGVGIPVADMVKKFFPNVVEYSKTSIEAKSFLVIEAKRLFKEREIEFDTKERDILDSFLSIRFMQTRSNLLTIGSERDPNNAHADIAWAIMYALGFQKSDGTSSLEQRVRGATI